MFCVKCGSKLENDSKFCTKCGDKIINNFQPEKTNKKVWSRKKGIWSIILSLFISSVFWLFILWGYSLSLEDEATNIIASAFETIGRQSQAWSNAESITELYNYAFTDECLNSQECIDDVVVSVTAIETSIEKEREEIENLWSSGTVFEDFDSFYSNTSYENQLILDRVLEQYFPEEAEEIESSVELL